MAYSEKVLDHYENPATSAPSARKKTAWHRHGRRAACGDVMKLQIKVGKDGVIEDAKFKTYGCGSAIASSSLVTEWVKGKTLDQALDIKNTQIAEELALPPVKIHCSILAEDAIKAAVADLKKSMRPDGLRRRGGTMAVTLSESAARHVSNFIAKRGKGFGIRLGVQDVGLFRHGLQARVRRPDGGRGRGLREPRRQGRDRPEEPGLSRRHRARLRARRPQRGLQVQQPERQGPVRLRRKLQRLEPPP